MKRVSLAHALLMAGEEEMAIVAALICWAEAIRRNYTPKGDMTNAVSCTVQK